MNIKKEALTGDLMKDELGSTGLVVYGETIDEEFLDKLKGDEGKKYYTQMRDNDAVVSAIMFVIETLVRGVNFEIEPYDQTNESLKRAEFVQQCLHDLNIPLKEVIAEILSFLVYGFDIHEIVYKKRGGYSRDPRINSKHSDGGYGWRKLAPRKQTTLTGWNFDEYGEVGGVYQSASPTYIKILIPAERYLHFKTTGAGGNPEGKSMLRGAWWAWYTKQKLEIIEGIGAERDLAGLPVMYVPPQLLVSNPSESDATLLVAIKNILKNIRRDTQEGLVVPQSYNEQGKKEYEFSLVSSAGSRQFDTNTIINRKKQEIAITTLCDFILIGHEAVGSFALVSSKTHLFATALGAFLDLITDVFNGTGIPRLLRLNNMPVEDAPKMVHGDIETPDLPELGAFIASLASAGMELFPDDKVEAYLRRSAGLPQKEVVE